MSAVKVRVTCLANQIRRGQQSDRVMIVLHERDQRSQVEGSLRLEKSWWIPCRPDPCTLFLTRLVYVPSCHALATHAHSLLAWRTLCHIEVEGATKRPTS